jgi:hypothetical protein
VGATEDSASGQVACHFGVSWGEVPNSLHQDSRYREVRSLDGVEVALKSESSRVYRSFDKSGFGGR